MADFTFSCPHCAQHLQGDAQFSDREIQCPTCSRSFRVPRLPGEAAPCPPGGGRPDPGEEDHASQQVQAGSTEAGGFEGNRLGQPPQIPIPVAPTEAELRAFFGPNADYYLDKWSTAQVRPGGGEGFNAAAFLLAGWWLPYRKLYGAAGVIWGIAFLVGLTNLLVPKLGAELPASAFLSSFFGLMLAIAVGWGANRMYLTKARKVIMQMRAQGPPGESRLAALGRRGGTSLPAALGFPLLFVVAVFSAVLALNATGLVASDYGRRLRFNGGEVYYQPPVTASQARRLGEYLVQIHYFDGKRKTIQLCQPGETVQLRAVVRAGTQQDPRVLGVFRQIGQGISENVFEGAPIEVDLCDPHFKTLLATSNFGKRLSFKASDLYYTAPVTEPEARKLGEYLVKTGFFDEKHKTVQVARSGETVEVRIVVREGTGADSQMVGLFKRFARELSNKVFGGAPLEVHLCDQYLATVRRISATD